MKETCFGHPKKGFLSDPYGVTLWQFEKALCMNPADQHELK